MAARLERARDLVDQLRAAGVAASLDPAEVGAQLPAVLVTPPTLEADSYGGPLATWSLFALVHGPAGARAWEQLDELLDVVDRVLPIERAEPAQYALATSSDPAPAYRLTFRENVES